MNSQLFECLLLSNDVTAVLAVGHQAKLATEAQDVIKDPMVLKFLGLKQYATYCECHLNADQTGINGGGAQAIDKLGQS